MCTFLCSPVLPPACEEGALQNSPCPSMIALCVCFCFAGGILKNLTPDQLQSFDAVTVRPRAVQPAPGIATAAAEGNGSHEAATAPGSTSTGAATESTLPTGASGSSGCSISSCSGGESLGPALASGVGLGRRDQVEGTGLGATSEEATSAAAAGAGGGVGEEEGGMTITVSTVHARWDRPLRCFTAYLEKQQLAVF